jgi:hypothetical protein
MNLNKIEILFKQIEQLGQLESILKKIHIGTINFKVGFFNK